MNVLKSTQGMTDSSLYLELNTSNIMDFRHVFYCFLRNSKVATRRESSSCCCFSFMNFIKESLLLSRRTHQLLYVLPVFRWMAKVFWAMMRPMVLCAAAKCRTLRLSLALTVALPLPAHRLPCAALDAQVCLFNELFKRCIGCCKIFQDFCRITKPVLGQVVAVRSRIARELLFIKRLLHVARLRKIFLKKVVGNFCAKASASTRRKKRFLKKTSHASWHARKISKNARKKNRAGADSATTVFFPFRFSCIRDLRLRRFGDLLRLARLHVLTQGRFAFQGHADRICAHAGFRGRFPASLRSPSICLRKPAAAASVRVKSSSLPTPSVFASEMSSTRRRSSSI